MILEIKIFSPHEGVNRQDFYFEPQGLQVQSEDDQSTCFRDRTREKTGLTQSMAPEN